MTYKEMKYVPALTEDNKMHGYEVAEEHVT